MSVWTHVNGCIRIDGLELGGMVRPSENEVSAALGNTVDFDDPEVKWDACTVPRGSEGSLKYRLMKVGDGLVLWTIPVWGDLRDYDDTSAIKEWFEKVTTTKGFLIRDAVLQVTTEGREPVVLTFKHASEDGTDL